MKRPAVRLCLFVAITFLLLVPMAQAQVPAEPGDWPQWRGPQRDGINRETGLLKEWPQDGPPLLWQVETVGIGYSSLAVKGGRIYTQGDLGGVEHVLALDARTGQTLWAVQPAPVAEQLADKVASEFRQTDKDENGVIDELEALRRLGWDFQKYDRAVPGEIGEIARRRAAALFAQLDENADGKLSYAEAGKELRDQFERSDTEDKAADADALATQRAADLVTPADKDGDGKVSREEARGQAVERYFGRADQKDPTTNRGDDLLTAAELTEYFRKSEAGRDGQLTLAELENLYLRSKVVGDGQLTPEELRGVYGGYRNGMGDGPRGTPTVDGDRLYVEGGHGDVSCLEAATGKTLWHVNLRTSFGGGLPGWGYSESPLIAGDLVIVTPGGAKGTLVALNKLTGELVWQSAGIKEGAHYSSPVLADIAGTRQIVQFSSGSVFGVSLQDGKYLWQYKAPANGTANCCAPIVDGDYVFASSSYGTGGGLAHVTGGGDAPQVEQVYFEKKMACHHGGIVKVGEYLYSNGGGALICMHFQTGKIAWQARSVGKGSLLVADGMLYLFSEGHEVALAEATPEEYRERGRFKINAHGRPSWAHPVVAGGRLLLRDQEWLAAYDLQARP
ncbi:MAG: PQQ-binding-like beta-propeller repeat protein [Pirellulales bacterium]